jgi:hypothetical protein
MVRWLGAGRVIDFLERLIEIARAADPRPLYSYASYPPTEYLLPANVDFYSFNVYLERRPDFERYVARLQNLAGDKPLILGEFGLDTLRKGEDLQAEILAWHLEVVVRAAPPARFSFRGLTNGLPEAQKFTDWEFGLVTRQRVPKRRTGFCRKNSRGPGQSPRECG